MISNKPSNPSKLPATPNNKDHYQNALSEQGRMIQRIFGQPPPPIDDDEDEDGYASMQANNNPLWLRPLRFTKRLLFPSPPREPGTLILVRHGESTWNANKTFTGWADPGLSERGVREVQHAARLLLEGGYEIDLVLTSRLQRAIRSAWILLEEMDQVYKPVFKSWRLNERMYGALTGLSKLDITRELGAAQVQEWRGSLTSRPPALSSQDEYWPGRDRRYADLRSDDIPLTESLLDCMQRTAPAMQKMLKEIKRGRNVLVVAHGNTLRGLVKSLDDIEDDAIRNVSIPTGIPIVYKFDRKMQVVAPPPSRREVCQEHMRGLFLEKPGLLAQALKREARWNDAVPGFAESAPKPTLSSLESSLYKLRAERELAAIINATSEDVEEDDGGDGNMGRPVQYIEDEAWQRGLQELQQQQKQEEQPQPTLISDTTTTSPCIKAPPVETIVPGLGQIPKRRDPVIVIIRHGKTEHNKLGLFTGWEDVPLAPEGVAEAKVAGQLLKRYGFEFDVVYTSWLSRAIETAWLCISEMDCVWLPIVKTWRLNERMYGKLTGLSKQMVRQRHGEEQFKAWRRGYDTPPPKVSSFAQEYPGNHDRYTKYVKDLPFASRESLIRSIEKGRPTLHRRLPKSESLKDCMDRTIPFFTECIVPQAIDKGQRVLISSSENAIRGLLMYLCDIPVDDDEANITELSVPNGVPIIFDVKSKCVKLLDDGSGQDPLVRYDFGKAAKYLFRPCLNDDGSPDEECFITQDDMVPLSESEMETLAYIKGPKS